MRRNDGGTERARLAGWLEAHPTSTSGLLCRSTICDAKLFRQSAALSVERTQSRYGLSA